MDPQENKRPESEKKGLWGRVKDQFALAPLVGKYYIPEETNDIWYVLGGLLAVSLAFEALTGVLLSFKYVPDSTMAYGIVSGMVHTRFWGAMVGFHYFNAFVMFGLVFLHMMRVFVSAAYRGGKKGLWFVGVGLAAILFVAYVTGEALHWDELGFAVPWHVSEVLQALGLSDMFHYGFNDLLEPRTATEKLAQIYAVHIALVPILILLLLPLHLYLIRMKGISLPFWKRRTGREVPFSTHLKSWLVYGSFMVAAVFLLAVTVGRSAGTAPQLIPSSPYYQEEGDAGDFGYKPSAPIGWTNGWNMIVEEAGVEEDIWGAMVAMAVMLLALVAVPFVDRQEAEPLNWREAFDLRKRGWAFLMMAVFWAVFLIGMIANVLAGAG